MECFQVFVALCSFTYRILEVFCFPPNGSHVEGGQLPSTSTNLQPHRPKNPVLCYQHRPSASASDHRFAICKKISNTGIKESKRLQPPNINEVAATPAAPGAGAGCWRDSGRPEPKLCEPRWIFYFQWVNTWRPKSINPMKARSIAMMKHAFHSWMILLNQGINPGQLPPGMDKTIKYRGYPKNPRCNCGKWRFLKRKTLENEGNPSDCHSSRTVRIDPMYSTYQYM